VAVSPENSMTIVPESMKVIEIAAPGGPEQLKVAIRPVPKPGRARPIIHATFPLAEAPAAHQLMESSSHIGKIVLTVPMKIQEEIRSCSMPR
jgi:hypothetical protein